MVLHSKIEGQGKPLIILHGFLGMSDNWKTLGTQFSKDGFQVHLLDLRNHGRSFHSDIFNYEVMVADVLAYCNHYNLENINMIGHSMGGKVALFFATKHPDKVQNLVVADIGPKYYPPHHQTILAGLKAVDFSKEPGRKQVEDILKNYISDFGTRQFLMKNLYWKTSKQLAFRFNLNVFLQNTEAIGEALPENSYYTKKVLFLRGDSSNYISDEDIIAIKHQFINAKIITINHSGHWLHVENPKDFYEETVYFLTML